MTPDEIMKLRALAEAATPEPWVTRVERDGKHPEVFVSRLHGVGVPPKWFVAFMPKMAEGDDLADAAFIAAARSAVPALLDEVERLTTERDEATQLQRAAAEILGASPGTLVHTCHDIATCLACGQFNLTLRARALKAESRVAEVEALLGEAVGAAEDLMANMGGHNHWDYTMQHGAGCGACIRQGGARTRARAVLAKIGGGK